MQPHALATHFVIIASEKSEPIMKSWKWINSHNFSLLSQTSLTKSTWQVFVRCLNGRGERVITVRILMLWTVKACHCRLIWGFVFWTASMLVFYGTSDSALKSKEKYNFGKLHYFCCFRKNIGMDQPLNFKKPIDLRLWIVQTYSWSLICYCIIFSFLEHWTHLGKEDYMLKVEVF